MTFLHKLARRLAGVPAFGAAIALLGSCNEGAVQDYLAPRNLARISVTPQAPSLTVGSSLQFAVAGTWNDGSSAVPAVTWSVNGGAIDANGLYTAAQIPGSYRVIATQRGGTRADTAFVSVVAKLTVFTIAPKVDTMVAGQTRQFSATLNWSDGQAHPVTISWNTTGGAISSTGEYSPGALVGSFLVVAACSCGAADTAAVTVRSPNPPASPTLMSLTLSPQAVMLALGGVQLFSPSGIWSDGTSGPVGVIYDATGGNISTAGLYFAGNEPGSYRIIATQQGGTRADTAFVTITGATLNQVVLNPSAVTVATGGAQQFSVAGSWSDGSSAAPGVTYAATGGRIGSDGLFTADHVPGTYEVIATQQGGSLADTSFVTITGPSLTQLVMNPSTVSVPPGSTQQFAVSASWSDGSSQLPPLSFNATGGTISAGGLYTAGSTPGTYQVIVRHQGGTKADTSSVTIPTLTGLSLSPSSASVAGNGAQLFSVTGTWSNGATTPPQVTYEATGGTIGPAGLYTAGSTTGTYRVIARHTYGTRADTSAVTITTAGPPPPPPPTVGSDSLLLRIERLDGGSGDVLVSNGIPLPPGRLRTSDLGRVRVLIGGVEQASYIEALQGQHQDGSLRSILVQFRTSVGPGTVPALLDFVTTRSAPSITKTTVVGKLPAAVALPVSPDYLVSTRFMGSTVTKANAPASPSYYPQYEANFVQWSDYHWSLGQPGYGDDWTTDYYDRAFAHFVFWARTGNSAYWVRAARIAYNYRTMYLEANAYGASEFWAQLEGLMVHYWLTGDERSRDAVYKTAESLHRSRGGIKMTNTWDHLWMDSRVQARVLLGKLLSMRLDAPPYGAISDWAAAARQDLTWILSTQAPDGSYRFKATCFQSNNFMSGMLDEVYTIYYDQLEPDSRIPPAVKRNLDFMWSSQWLPGDQVFKYYSGFCENEGGTSPGWDLNGFYVGSFGWYSRYSGDAAYRNAGEQVFKGLVDKTWLQGPKQFNQAYETSWRWLAYR